MKATSCQPHLVPRPEAAPEPARSCTTAGATPRPGVCGNGSLGDLNRTTKSDCLSDGYIPAIPELAAQLTHLAQFAAHTHASHGQLPQAETGCYVPNTIGGALNLVDQSAAAQRFAVEREAAQTSVTME